MTFDLDTRLEQGVATHKDVLEFLVSHYYAGVRHLALSLVQDSAEADDIAQKTMIKAAEKITSYQPHTNLKAWVYTFAVNIAKTQLRRRSTRQRIEGLLPSRDNSVAQQKDSRGYCLVYKHGRSNQEQGERVASPPRLVQSIGLTQFLKIGLIFYPNSPIMYINGHIFSH